MPDPTPAADPAPAAAPATPPAAAPAQAAAAAASAPAAAPAAPAAAPADPWKDYKPPEGFTVEEIKPVVEWAQKNGLDPKAAALIALRDKERSAAEEASFKQLAEKGWLEELQQDKELGGQNIRETMVSVTRAFDKLPAGVQKIINDEKMLYNPLIVRVLHAVGSGMKEDQFVRPGTVPSQQNTTKDPYARLEGIFGGQK